MERRRRGQSGLRVLARGAEEDRAALWPRRTALLPAVRLPDCETRRMGP